MDDWKLGAALRAIKAGVRVPQAGLVQKYSDSVFLLDLLRRLRVDCVIDVGANKGQFADKLRRMGYAGHIISFEPIPDDFAAIKRASANDSHWHAFNLALGADDEQREFTVVGTGTTVFSSFLEAIPEVTPEGRRQISVQVRRLDGLFDEIERLAGGSPRIFLKLDTQGYDLEVVKGCSDRLAKVLGLQSELSVEPIYREQPSYTEALAHYEALGFALMNLSIVNRSSIGGIREYDCVMARVDRLAN